MDTQAFAEKIHSMLVESAKEHGLKNRFNSDEERRLFRSIVDKPGGYDWFKKVLENNGLSYGNDVTTFCYDDMRSEQLIEKNDFSYSFCLYYGIPEDVLLFSMVDDGASEEYLFVDRNGVDVRREINDENFDENFSLKTIQEFLDEKIPMFAKVNDCVGKTIRGSIEEKK